MEGGLMASIMISSWGILLYGATTGEANSSVHAGGLVAIAVGAVGAVVTIGGHMIAMHRHHR